MGAMNRHRKKLAILLLLASSACSDRNPQAVKPGEAGAECLDASAIEYSVDIPSGRYQIGDERFYPEERPARTVEVAAFNIDATEVTNRQFAEFVDTTGYVTRAERGLPESEFDDIAAELRRPGSAVFTPPGKGRTINPATWWRFVEGASWRAPAGPGSSIEGIEDRPVVHIAFEDAQAFAKWKGRRLPTEEEWEIAARGTIVGAAYSWGDEPPEKLQHAPGNTWQGIFPVINLKEDGYEGVAPVGCYPPNGYGLYDMIGNVWELTSSEYAPDTRNAYGDQSEMSGPPRSSAGVIKGGSFLCAENYCARYRPAARQPLEWALGSSHIGFRTAKSTD